MSNDNSNEILAIKLKLSDETSRLLHKKIVGTGGMQSLLRQLQNRLFDDDTLILTQSDIKKIRRYAGAYGKGGWQQRLDSLIEGLK
jgi:hypothetical protein